MEKSKILEELKEDIIQKYESKKKEAKFVFKSKFAVLSFNILVGFLILILVCFILLPVANENEDVNYYFAVGLFAFVLVGIGYALSTTKFCDQYVKTKMSSYPELNMQKQLKDAIDEQVESYPEWIAEMENSLIEEKEKFRLLQEIQKELPL